MPGKLGPGGPVVVTHATAVEVRVPHLLWHLTSASRELFQLLFLVGIGQATTEGSSPQRSGQVLKAIDTALCQGKEGNRQGLEVGMGSREAREPCRPKNAGLGPERAGYMALSEDSE